MLQIFGIAGGAIVVRISGNHPAETTGKMIVAKFEHGSTRPVNGYAAPQLYTHLVIFNAWGIS